MLHQIMGVDPGIVHTGLVLIDIHAVGKEIWIRHHVISGIDGLAADLWKKDWTTTAVHVFQEKYQPRGALNHNVNMVKAEQTYKQALDSKLILNTGVKKIVRKPLMELLGVWSFATVTHHQDLRSAARIALYGALKDDELNTLLTTVVSDHLEGRTWNVRHH